MEVTGYKLREALKMASLELETVKTQFDESLYAFDGEEKDSPEDISDKIRELEIKVARLQAAQEQYNQKVTVDVNGSKVILAVAIKLVGGAGRVAKMWKQAAKGSVRDRWSRHQAAIRKADEEVAKPTIDKSDALKLAKDSERYAASLRSAIAYGNTSKVAVDFVDESLLS
jgi:hypothetical protein